MNKANSRPMHRMVSYGPYLGAIVFVCLFCVPLFGLSEFWLFTLTEALCFVLLASSFGWAHAYGGILSLCQASFFGIGAYGTALLSIKADWPVSGAILAGAIVAGVVALVLSTGLLRMGQHGAVIGTVIFATVLSEIADTWTSATGGEDGLVLTDFKLGLGPISVALGSTKGMYYVCLIVVLMIVGIVFYLSRTYTWKILRAISANRTRAEFLGYRSGTYRTAVFGLAGVVAGIGGGLLAAINLQVTTTTLGLGTSINGALWAVIGGSASPFGGLFGVFLLSPASTYFEASAPGFQIINGIILVLVIMYLPRGIAGLLTVRRRAPRGSPDRGSSIAAGSDQPSRSDGGKAQARNSPTVELKADGAGSVESHHD